MFYSDYYGNPVKDRPLVPNLGKLIKLRRSYAYGDQQDYWQDAHTIGWVRRGDREHPNSGIAVLLSNNGSGEIRMSMGKEHAGEEFCDVLGASTEPVVIDEEGFGLFSAQRNMTVWAQKPAFEDLIINE